jgi:hypothetical protein
MGTPKRETILPLTLQQLEPDITGPQPPRAVLIHRPIRRQPGRTAWTPPL